MSKSRGNVVNPDEIVAGLRRRLAAALRDVHGPLEATKPWSMQGVKGVRRFLDRAWRMIIDDRAETLALNASVQDVEPTDEQNRVLHRTIMAVTQDIEQLEFNTAIARMMEFVNFFTKEATRPRRVMETFVLLLVPLCPAPGRGAVGGARAIRLAGLRALAGVRRIADARGHDRSAGADRQESPREDHGARRRDTGAAGGRPRGPTRKWRRLLAGKQIVKVIVVPGRLVNFVVK